MDGAFLKLRGRSWYVRVVVPKELQKRLGKREIVKALGTRCLSDAQRLRWPVVAQIQASFRESGHVPDIEEALVNARALAVLSDPDERESLENEASWVAEDMEPHVGTAAAKLWFDTATGKGLPMSKAVDRWLAEETTFQKQTVQQHRAAVSECIGFLGDHLLGDVTRRHAGEFVTEHLKKSGISGKTINRKISSLTRLWRWALRRGHADINPWLNQGLRKSELRQDQKDVRAFTPEELRKLLTSTPRDRLLLDLTRISLFTGARINEICTLEVEDVEDGGLHIRAGKTESAARWLPIAEDIQEIIDRRATGEGWLFPNLKPGGPDKKRSWNVQKRVNRWIGKVLDAPKDASFHSLRHAYSTACEQVSLHQYTHCELMGHKKPNLATQVYSEGQSVTQLRAAQRKVSRHIRRKWLERPS